ncbi:MAG TPA: hypothetical protein PLN63_06440, partial [Paludibacteraceae bacterium]|nr:hypothetical protein [Paludibacteraceae bacterium]
GDQHLLVPAFFMTVHERNFQRERKVGIKRKTKWLTLSDTTFSPRIERIKNGFLRNHSLHGLNRWWMERLLGDRLRCI